VTDIRAVKRVKGSLFSVEALNALSDEICSVFFVSPRTEHLASEMALNEVNFIARYASSFEVAGKYFPVDPDNAAEMDLIADVARNFKLEVKDVSSEIIQALDGIKEAILTTGSNACACGTVGEALETTSGVPNGTPPEGFGEPDPAVADRLCKAANAIHKSIRNTVEELDLNGVEGFLSLGFGIVTGLVSAIIAAQFIPIVGILLVGVAGAVIGVTLAILAAGIDLDRLAIDLDDFTDPLVCALVEATSATAARDAYKQVLTDAGNPAANVALVGALLTNNVLDLLWFSTPDSEAFLATYVPPFNCSSCAEPCELFFMLFVDLTTRGTGNIDKDAASRTLTSREHPSNGFHYISVGVSQLFFDTGLFTNCDGMEPTCVGSDDETFDFKPTALTGYDEAGSIGTKCVSGSHSVIWTAVAPTLGVTYEVSFFQFTSNDPFTLDCEITQL